MYKACKTFGDQSERVDELAGACIALKAKLGYSDADARSVALNNITAVARSAQMTLNLLDSWSKGDNTVRQLIPQLIGLNSVTPNGAQMAGAMLEKTNKLALILLAQFQIENVLRNIARELTLPNPGAGFYPCADAVLNRLAIPVDRMDILNTGARIRNSLHANGIHHTRHSKGNPVVIVCGVTYKFVDGKSVDCASWEHIAHALESAIGVLEEVFLSADVLAIPEPMFEQYAWEQVTNP